MGENKVRKAKNGGKKEKNTKEKKARHNPKAFTFSGGVKSVQKKVQHALDQSVKKEHAPKLDKTPDIAPPYVVIVQGPKGCGKTTLIRSLVKHYTKQNLSEIHGPIVLVSNKQRRLTFIEAPTDIAAQIDLAKVADLALLMIDASYGFEMETFEFINIMQNHGMPKILGVLTHLDKFPETKVVRHKKKELKARFWAELYDGAKLFYFSGLQYGRYPKNEIVNLTRHLATAKVPLLSWRQAHPYVIATRYEDQTDPRARDPENRRIFVYGYTYGARLREGQFVHLCGVGDFPIASVEKFSDPCPSPQVAEWEKQKLLGRIGNPKKVNSLRTLQEKHKAIYAPGCDIGNVLMDKDALYINLPKHEIGFTQKEGEAEDAPEAVTLVRELQKKVGGLNATTFNTKLSLTKNSTLLQSEERDTGVGISAKEGEDEASGEEDEASGEEEGSEEDGSEEEKGETKESKRSLKGEKEEFAFNSDEEDSEGNLDELENLEHKKQFLQEAHERHAKEVQLEDLIYGHSNNLNSLYMKKLRKEGVKKGDVTKTTFEIQNEEKKKLDLFSDSEEEEVRTSEADNTFDSWGLLSLSKDNSWKDALAKEDLKSRKFITGGWDSAEENDSSDEEYARKRGIKMESKEKEEGEEKAEVEETKDKKKKEVKVEEESYEDLLNRRRNIVRRVNNEDMVEHEDAIAIGSYVRIILEDVPALSVASFSPDRPMILGGLLPGELKMGMLQLRIKRHRFQTTPIFSLEDRGEKRMRYLKYTPEHMHCHMTMYGPQMPPSTGCVFIKNWGQINPYRISATGLVIEVNTSFKVMKKLKLVGEPYKIFKNTSFVKNMFTSDLEVNKCLNAKIQTVSGIRGQVKKAEGGRGEFRATFEDKLLLSDLVLMKTWVSTLPKPFYNPMLDVGEWRRMKSVGELRYEQNLKTPHNKDSNYGKQIVRGRRVFERLQVPKQIAENLPFKSMNKGMVALTKKTGEKKQIQNVVNGVIRTDREKEVNRLYTELSIVKKSTEGAVKETKEKKFAEKKRKEIEIQKKRDLWTADHKKKRYIKQGMEEDKKRKKMRLG